MSGHFPAKIEIGGAVPAHLIPGLIEAIVSDGPTHAWGDAAFAPESAEDLLAEAEAEDGFLRLFDDEARNPPVLTSC